MNNKLLNGLKIITVIIFVIVFTIGFNHHQDIDDFAYTVALGIDSGKNNNLEITFQFSRTTGSGESGSSSEAAPSFIYTIEASSVSSGIQQINNYISKEANLSHCKLIVISEELAQKGIVKEISTLINDVELRPDTGIVISKCTAKSFIGNLKPDFETLVSKYYEIVPMTKEVTGFTAYIKISDFFNSLYAKGIEPCAILRRNFK